MFKALLLKHLKQARVVVLTGSAFTLVLPFLAGLMVVLMWGGRPSVGQDFLSTGWSMVLGLGFCPLWMWLITLQIFAGDRACGAGDFLLERPVRPRTLWWSRVAASWISFGIFFLVSSLAWWLVARGMGGQSSLVLGDALWGMLALAGGFMPLVFAAGALAAACGFSGFNGLYLAAALTGLPLLPALWFVTYLTSPRFAMHPWMIPVTLVEAIALIYTLTAFVMQATGEPLGRKKFRRGGLVSELDWRGRRFSWLVRWVCICISPLSVGPGSNLRPPGRLRW